MSNLPVAISHSGGAASEWPIHAITRGLIPRPDIVVVVGADTTAEHRWTYERIEYVKDLCQKHGIEYISCRRQQGLTDHLLQLPRWSGMLAKAQDMAKHRQRAGYILPAEDLWLERLQHFRVDQPPIWIAKGNGRGRAMHRCTREFKVAPMRRAVAAWLSRNSLPKQVVRWIGFGADEVHRAQKALAKQDVQWERLDFPAIRMGRTRAQIRAEVTKWTGSAPNFSMCVFCPFKSPARWLETEPEDLEIAYRVDEAIRDLDHIGLTDGPGYLTDRLIPIRKLIERGDPQPDLPGLESYCDGGACFL